MISLGIQIGRLHPLFVHLPIGILALAFVLELMNRKNPTPSSHKTSTVALGLAALSALISLGTGWLLGNEGDYSPELLDRHKWLAVAFTVGCLLLLGLRLYPKPWSRKVFLPTFVLVLVIMSVTGHYGGSMTHGEAYLFESEGDKEIVIADIDQAVVYRDIIHPILDKKCVGCHNPGKPKGDLLLHEQAGILAGGKNGPLFSKDSTESLFLTRIHLPLEHDDHMPPKGKSQLSEGEMVLLEWWIANENCFDCTTQELTANARMASLLKSLEQDQSPRAKIAKTLSPVDPDWVSEAQQLGISLQQIAASSPLVQVSLANRKDISPDIFDFLESGEEHIVELNLAYSNFNDTLAKHLKPFKNLTKLQLQGTPISDRTLERLPQFEFLESLNLYNTAVSDQSIPYLEALPMLKEVYLWQTDVSEAGIDSYASKHPSVDLNMLDPSLFAQTALAPPMIRAATTFFTDTLTVTLEHSFNDIEMFYTLDGSTPDTTSFRYSHPLVLDSTVTLTTFAKKEGWGSGPIATASFIKNAVSVIGATLDKTPPEKYAAEGANTLIDLKRGSTNFVDGNWIGMEGQSFTITMDLGNLQEISKATIGALTAPGNWIFYPRGFRVWASENGASYTQIAQNSYPEQQPNVILEQRFFNLSFPKTKATHVKVEIISQLKNPKWHPQPDGKSWLFIDEIILN